MDETIITARWTVPADDLPEPEFESRELEPVSDAADHVHTDGAGHSDQPDPSLASRLSASRELRNARRTAESIVADAEHRAGVLLGQARLLIEEARAERSHVDRYSRMAADRAASVLAAAQAEQERIVAVARMKASLIVSAARSEAARLTREAGEPMIVELIDRGDGESTGSRIASSADED